jgi:hypothetical protein
MSEENTPVPSEPPAPEEPAKDQSAKSEAQPVEPVKVEPVKEEPSAEDPQPPEKSEGDKHGEPKTHRRKPHFLVTWAIVLLVAGFVDFCSTLTSKEGAKELRAENQRVMNYLHNLQPFQATDDFTARLDSNEYGWCLLNWDAPFNVTVARDRINERFTQQIEQAKDAASNDPGLPAIEARLQQAWQQQPSASPRSLFSSEAPSLAANPQEFDDAVDHILQGEINALPARQEQRIWTLGPEIDMVPSLDSDSFSPRASFYQSQLPLDPDFSRVLATFQTAILMAGIHYEDAMKRLNFCRLPAFLRGGEDTAPLELPQDNSPNIFVEMVTKATGLLDAYMNTVRLSLAKSRAQSVIAIAALVIGAILLFFSSKNNCLTVVIKLFFIPLAGSLVVGLVWGIAYVITLLFGKILAAPAIDVLGSAMATPILHWGAGRLMEHHLSEKAIEKYAHAAERKLLDK